MLFDPVFIERLVDLVPPWLAVLLAILSFLGSAVLLTPLLLGWYAYRPRERVLAWIGFLFGAFALRAFAKALNDIERPTAQPDFDPAVLPWVLEPVYTHPVGIDTTSFPSGHMIAGIVFWGLMAADLEYGTRRRRIAFASVILVIIACSRVLIGSHWIEDVIAGVVLGTGLLAVALFGRTLVDREVELAFGLAFVIAAIDVLTVTTLSGGAIFSVSWGVFIGLAVRGRAAHLPGSPIATRSDSIALVFAAIGAGIALAAILTGALEVLRFLVLMPIAAIAIHWHPARLRRLDSLIELHRGS